MNTNVSMDSDTSTSQVTSMHGATPPHGAVQISDSVYWIGATDPTLRSFDIILDTENGTTYNAYLVRGEDGVAVIDTVKEAFSKDFFERLESVTRYDEIKYIVLNHLEPDHTGALPELIKRAPQAKVYISKKAQIMLKALLKSSAFEFEKVDTGDTISLGDRTLRFIHTPFLHWPDTQCTYLEEEQTLFSGDIFGCHFCDTRLYNDLVDDFHPAFDYYYNHIMRPFKRFVRSALALIEPLAIKTIAPTHGPVLRDNPRLYIQRYRELSEPTVDSELDGREKTLLIFYISSYGNTARMAEAIYSGVVADGRVCARLYDLEGHEIAPLVDLIEAADGIMLGTPTINADAVKPVWDLLSSLNLIEIKGKTGAAFGSFGWSGEAVTMVEDRLKGLKLSVPLHGKQIRLIPTEEELGECRDFGRQMVEALIEE